jgi:hypothetical protein
VSRERAAFVQRRKLVVGKLVSTTCPSSVSNAPVPGTCGTQWVICAVITLTVLKLTRRGVDATTSA